MIIKYKLKYGIVGLSCTQLRINFIGFHLLSLEFGILNSELIQRCHLAIFTNYKS